MAEKIPVEVAGIDPRLDNRTGDQRPVTDQPQKPQQVDGPDNLLELKQADEKQDEKPKADDKPTGTATARKG